jgi:hypothetical protein
MSIPEGALPAYFPPQERARVFAAGEVLFLVDPTRLTDLGGTHLLRHLALDDRRGGNRKVLAEGAVAPAIGLEPGYYTVMVRSTDTEAAMVPLSHIAFSVGFVVGTETGELEIWSGDRLTPDDARAEGANRSMKVSPGWYGVTVVAGIRMDDQGDDTEEWVCCFLLEPRSAQPELLGDMTKVLSFFG